IDVATQQIKLSFLAYAASFTGGVRVATGDVNGDGILDLITVPGPGIAGEVKVWSGLDGSKLYDFYAVDATYTAGLFVAAGDVNGDGAADIVVGLDAGSVPEVKLFGGGTS